MKPKIFAATCALWACTVAFGANPGANVFAKPDFAYPKTVSRESSRVMNAALKAGRDTEAVRALMNYTLAETAVDSHLVPQMYAGMDSVAGLVNGQCRILVYLLQAEMLDQVYRADRYKFDRRDAATSGSVSQLGEWSGRQFVDSITALYDKALALASGPDGAAGIESFEGIITSDRNARAYFPTLGDFAACKAYEFFNYGNCHNSVTKAQRNLLVSKMAAASASAPQVIWWRVAGIGTDMWGQISSQRQSVIRELKELYGDMEASEYSGDVLLAIDERLDRSDHELVKWLYDASGSNLRRYPGYYRAGCLKNIVSGLAAPAIRVSSAVTVYPETELPVAVNLTNLTSFKIEVMEVPASYPLSNGDRFEPQRGGKLTPIKTIEYDMAGRVVPFSADTVVNITFPASGRYVLRAVTGNESIDKERFMKDSQIVYCTTLAPFVAGFGQASTLYAVDGKSGSPLKNVNVKLTANRKPQRNLGMTGRDGDLALPSLSGRVHLSDKESRFSRPLYVYGGGNDSSDKTAYTVNIFTSLGLYHPGDTVEWSAVVCCADRVSASLLGGARVKLRATDANYQEFFTDTLTTDSWGRVQGKLMIPGDRLTGSYMLTAKIIDKKNSPIGSVSFMVSDYKLPTFKVELDKPEKLADGSMRISGSAVGYNGFPAADAQVSVEIGNDMWRPWRFWQTVSTQLTTLRTTADAKGSFSVVIPDSLLVSAPYPAGLFTAAVSVMSVGGETVIENTYFQNKENCAIQARAMQVIDATEPVKLDLSVVDIDMKPMAVDVAYELKSADTVVSSGVFSSISPVIDFRNVAPGMYTLRFTVPSMDGSEPVEWHEVAVYRPGDNRSPSSKPLWIPEDSAIASASGKATFTYATPEGRGWVLCTIVDEQGGDIISHRWIEIDGGLHKLDVSLPKGVDKATVSLVSVRDFVTSTLSVKVTRKDTAKGVKINIAGMRDRTEPLGGERWDITLADLQGRPVEGAVMLDMWAAALGSLGGDPSWAFRAERPYLCGFNFIVPSIGSNYLSGGIAMPKYRDCEDLVNPDFQLWGRGWSPETMFQISNLSAGADRGMKLSGASAPTMAARTYDSAKAEVEEEIAADDDMGVGEGAENSVAAEPKVSYRPSEIPLAFFRPMLTTDSKGRLHYSFTMPNAVTEWKVNALAFTRDLCSDMQVASIIASKPLMVNPNMPRFVRSGDEVVIRTVTMNASDTTLAVNTVAELFDVTTGKVLMTDGTAAILDPNEQGVSRLSFKVPADATMLRFRVRGVTDGFSDGEQALIPVLPSVSEVMESQPFYLTPDSLAYTMRLPEIPEDANVTLQYCDNPLWTVVTALPGISQGKPTTSTEAAANIFSASVAGKIVRENPVIVDALRKWISEGAVDSTLVSMLERNPELKQLALSSTPWVRDARSDSERMMRLAMLLDEENIKSSVKEAVKILSGLYVKETGGWRWTSFADDASEWATMRVLSLIGALNSAGAAPSDTELDKMISGSLRYIDSKVAREAAKYPKQTFEAYTLMRGNFTKPVPSGAAVAVNRTVQRLVTGWKKLSPVPKAEVALILHEHGYRNVAAQAVESLDQYALTSPVKGMWWDGVSVGGASRILSAYAVCGAGRHKVDMIRQWLIWQKEAQNWGDCADASMAVASVLTTSRTWLRPSGTVSVTLAGRTLNPLRADYGSGYFAVPLDGHDLSGALLTIHRSGSAPAWGGVTFSYTAPMDSIRSASIDELKIEKHLFRGVAGPSGIQWVETDTMAVGDRVKVVLTINSERTMDYVTIVDERAAGFEPVEQIPHPIVSEGIYFYRENRDSDTRMFVDRLPEGTYQLTYELMVNNCGVYSSGIATVQSQLNTTMTAHSAGSEVTLVP